MYILYLLLYTYEYTISPIPIPHNKVDESSNNCVNCSGLHNYNKREVQFHEYDDAENN